MIVATGPVHPVAVEILGPIETPEDWHSLLPEAEALIVRGNATVGEQELAAATRLRVIGRSGVGVDRVDVASAAARGIPVVVTPGANARAVAEGALTLMLALVKRLPELQHALLERDWGARDRLEPSDLEGTTLGIVGYGRIGRELADLARALGMHVLAHDPLVDDATTPLGALFENADIVSLHAPLTDETRGIVGPKLLACAKPGLVLVNTARGGLVSSLDDLLAALEDGRLGGVGLDVFEEEPPDPSHPLFAHPRVVATPHALGLTLGAREAVFRAMAEGVAAVLRGETPPNVA
ncbi:MAG: hydroxyacid dehydrogenase [Actinobacteria bacterium]|nr:hydroxyacid dehydrogenase [Actinomycetota bacterium]